MNKLLPEETYKSLLGVLQSIKNECDDAALSSHPDPIQAGRYGIIGSARKLAYDALIQLDFQSTESMLNDAAEMEYNKGVKAGRWDTVDPGKKDPIISPMIKGYTSHCAAAIHKLAEVISDPKTAYNHINKTIGYLLELKHAFKL